MKSRHSLAIKWTIGVFLLLVCPIIYRIVLENRKSRLDADQLGEMRPFVLHDVSGGPITKDSLYKSVTIVLNFPSRCTDETCKSEFSQAREIVAWVKGNLTIEHAEEKNPLNLLVTGRSSFAEPGWRLVKEIPELGTLVPSSISLELSQLVVVDPWGKFSAAWDLSKPINHEDLQRVLSRTSFEQYLGNYLARRTFMGPRKDR